VQWLSKFPPPLVLLLLCAAAAAQDAPETVQPSPSFRELARASGWIFTGTVTSVQLASPDTGDVPFVQVTFKVTKAFRGVHSGQTLSIREWAGLWNSGERFRVGEHLLLFLYPPSKLGLTSVVGGTAGRIQATPGSDLVLSGRQYSAWFQNDPGRRPHDVSFRVRASQMGAAISQASRPRE